MSLISARKDSGCWAASGFSVSLGRLNDLTVSRPPPLPRRTVFVTTKAANTVPFLPSLFPLLLGSRCPQKGTEGFWKSVAHHVPREASEMRILNPYFIQEAAFQFIGLPFNNGLMGKGVRGASDARGKRAEIPPPQKKLSFLVADQFPAGFASL